MISCRTAEPTPSTSRDERNVGRDLVTRIQTGDRTAEHDAWQRYTPKLRRALSRYARCTHDVDDWVSATWEIALPKLRSGALTNAECCGAFLHGIARRVALGDLRKCTWLTYAGNWSQYEVPIDDTQTPEGIATRDQDITYVSMLIESMPIKRDRDLLRMRYLQDSTTGELSEILHLSGQQVSNTLWRARQRLLERAR